MRGLVFMLTFLNVLGRHSLMAAWFNCAGSVHQQLDLSSSTIGTIDMVFLMFYALGNFILGILGDKYRQKYVLCLFTAFSCGVYGIVRYIQIILLSAMRMMPVWGFAVLFAMLGFCQSAIWPMTVAIMGQEYSHEVRGKIIGIWSVNSAVGDIIGYFFSSFLLYLGCSWVLVSVIFLALFSIIVTLTWFFLPLHGEREILPRISVLQALKLPTVTSYCLCYACMKLLHMGILIWIPYYLEVVRHLSFKTEGLLMMLYGSGGVIGGMLSGWISDKVSDRSYVLLTMLIASVPVINLLNFVLSESSLMSYPTIFIVGGLVSGGSNLLSAVVAADMCDLETHLEAKSTLTGLVDAFGGVGASLGQVIIGNLQGYSWNAVFYVMILMDVLGMVSIMPVVSKAFARNNEGYRKDPKI